MKNKGISTLIAEAIVIAIVLSVGGTLVVWYTGLINIQQDRSMSQVSMLVDCSQSDSSFFDLQFNGNRAVVLVRNAGYSDDVIEKVFIYGSITGSMGAMSDVLSLDLPRSTMRQIDVDLGIITCENFWYAEIITRCGSYKYEGTPRGC
ncbi:MAG: hypothetical protein ABIA21_01520 [Candidatus Aenigmatarchaeota archaeon]